MRKAINITAIESDNVENLFMKYNSYMSMLQYCAAEGMENSTVYDKKWNEASIIWIELDKAKRMVEKKYKPAGEWDSYEFDFDNQQVVFIKND